MYITVENLIRIHIGIMGLDKNKKILLDNIRSIYMNYKKVIFLDIDGVIQPYNANQRFMVNRKSLIERISFEYQTDYNQYDEFDVAAVYYDWNMEAISIINYIIDKTNAYLVISSNWRNHLFPNKMKDLLKIHNLDIFYLGDTPDIISIPNYKNKLKLYHYKVIEILAYLEQNPDITNYVVIDDLDLSIGLDNHFVKTNNLITKEEGDMCIKILQRKKI